MTSKASYFPKAAGHILEFVCSIRKKSLSLLFRILLYLVEACPVLMQEKFARYSTVYRTLILPAVNWTSFCY